MPCRSTGNLVNTVTVANPSGLPDPVPGNNTSTDTDTDNTPLPGITIVKTTNGTDNDSVPGPTVAVGSTVTWTYTVKNTGAVALNTVAVTDDKVGAITCPATTLAVGASMTCTKTGTAVAGRYTNTGTVTAKSPTSQAVTASNVDHYFGVTGSQNLVHGDTATIGYWHNGNGQALIKSLNGGPTATKLATWLATTYPNLYGPAAGGARNLTGKNNNDVAALFLTFFTGGFAEDGCAGDGGGAGGLRDRFRLCRDGGDGSGIQRLDERDGREDV